VPGKIFDYYSPDWGGHPFNKVTIYLQLVYKERLRSMAINKTHYLKQIKNMKSLFILFVLFSLQFEISGQATYQYSVDLTQIKDDNLHVDLITPKIDVNEIIFYLPKIVPGTYNNSEFGKFIHNLKAFNKSGKELNVTPTADGNGWKIKKAKKIYKISYEVEDTWDANFKHQVYEMAGTNFEANKNFVLNNCGVFGYFEGMKKLQFQLSFTKPTALYASTALIPVSSNSSTDIFVCKNADHLYDSPIMYCIPDTTVVKVGSTDVLISVYSPRHLITSKFVAEHLSALLEAAKNYLGGKLPVSRYAFLYYFNSEQPTVQGQGAWEHSYSSFYSMTERPQAQAINQIVDFSSHEFFHIITPLSICSKEVREFNFNETILSKHLWLYEGSTEYDAHHTQVTQGLITPEEFLKRLSQKILFSRSVYNDALPFTQLSLGSAGQYQSQYGNVYQKGALISACLDLYLYKLSGGNYGIKDLKHDLSLRYGAENYFKEDELFDEITRLTYPEIRGFFSQYVEGNTPIPYEQFFGMAGVQYTPSKTVSTLTLGRIVLDQTNPEKFIVNNISGMNDFGKKIGYQVGDEITSINDLPINLNTMNEVLKQLNTSVKDGDLLTIKLNRKNAEGTVESLVLKAPAMKSSRAESHFLEFVSPNEEQLKVRQAWLHQYCN
jgi:predicted metalloprotease with PDZ domain